MQFRWFPLGAACLVTAGIGWMLVLQGRAYLAYTSLFDESWARAATTAEIRDTAHEALGYWFGDPHDAFVLLNEVGDASSIPYLQKALARAPQIENEGIECTWAHGYQALSRAQGRSTGVVGAETIR